MSSRAPIFPITQTTKGLFRPKLKPSGPVRSSSYDANDPSWVQDLLRIDGKAVVLLRGIIVNRAYGTHKKLYVCRVLLTIFGPIYNGPPK